MENKIKMSKYRVPVTTVSRCTECGLSWALSRSILLCTVCEKDAHVICYSCFKEKRESTNHNYKVVRYDPKGVVKRIDRVPQQSKLHTYIKNYE
jgi:hypothetical protein